jgi:6-phosphogluconate dehydrogenase
MEMGMVGLGRMGGNMALRLLRKGHRVVGFDPSDEQRNALKNEGGIPAATLQEFVERLESRPRVMWVMVPAGQVTTETIAKLAELGNPDDIVIDGGNTNWKVALKDAELLKSKGMHYLDAGTSGGIWGLKNGYCMMVGGEPEAVKSLEPVFRTLAPEGGYLHVGGPGAGHYVKMVHNGIEYGLMQSYAEGFEIMHASAYHLDLAGIANMWLYGSVVRSWLLELAASALADDQDLTHLKGWVADSGEGRWTVQEAIDLDVPAPVITLSLLTRFRSRQSDSYGAKVLAALRNEFGGHAVKTE